MEVWKRVGSIITRNNARVNLLRDHAGIQQLTSLHPDQSICSVLRPIIHLVKETRFPSCRKFYPMHSDTLTKFVSALYHCAYHQGENVVHELLCTRVSRSARDMQEPETFANNDLWRKRSRACIETTASLVCCTNAKLAWFGDFSELLEWGTGRFERVRELSFGRNGRIVCDAYWTLPFTRGAFDRFWNTPGMCGVGRERR